HGVGDAGVAAGGVEQAAGGADEAALLRVEDDGGGGAVLDGAAGVVPLRLAEDLDAGQTRGEAIELHQRGVADAFEDAGSKRFGGCDHAAFRLPLCRAWPDPALKRGRRMCESYNKSNVWHPWRKRSSSAH